MCYDKNIPTEWLKQLNTGNCTCEVDNIVRKYDPLFVLSVGQDEYKCPFCLLKEREAEDARVS